MMHLLAVCLVLAVSAAQLEMIPSRMVLAILASFGFQFTFLLRYSFSVISVGMIKSTMSAWSTTNTGNDSDKSVLLVKHTNVSSSNYWMHDNEPLEWSETVRGLFLGSFFYGAATTQILGGRLAEIYGTKNVFGLSVVAPAIFMYVIPLGAKIHYSIAVLFRILQGVFQGMSWPSMHALLSKWIPPNERSRFVGIIYYASTGSLVYVMPLTGAIMEKYSWESACYIMGVFPVIWAILWWTLIYDTPSLHPRISEKEKSYIETATKLGGTSQVINPKNVPWKSIFTSLPVIAIIIIDQGNCWGMTIFSTQLPRYINEMHGYQFTKSGLYGDLPFMFRYFGAVIFSCIVDWIISTEKLSIGITRRIFGAIGTIVPAIVMVLFLYVEGNFATIVSLQCLTLFFNGAVSCSHIVNAVDISPNYAGTVFGIVNTLYSMLSFITPILIGLILDSSYESHEKWNIVFWTCVPIYIFTGAFYVFFGSGEVQPWNNFSSQKEKSNLSLEEMPEDNKLLQGNSC